MTEPKKDCGIIRFSVYAAVFFVLDVQSKCNTI